MDTSKGALIAASIAGLLTVLACSSKSENNASTSQEVKCEGINECKGTSECKGSGANECQGLNECKGQGWITVPREECTKKGGKVLGEGSAAKPDAAAATDAVAQGETGTRSYKCQGINECKGTGSCALPGDGGNACKGHNECKGQGWVEVPAETDCTSKGGTILS